MWIFHIDSKEIEHALENNTRHSLTPENKSKLAQSSSLLIHCPVLDNNNNVIPLNEHNIAIEYDAWGDKIGFGSSPKALLKFTADEYSEARKHVGCSFNALNGEAIHAFPVPVCDNMRDDAPSNVPLPTCSIFHFDVIIVRCFQSITSQEFVSSRLGRECSKYRSELTRTVSKLLSLNKVALQSDKVPLQIDAWSL